MAGDGQECKRIQVTRLYVSRCLPESGSSDANEAVRISIVQPNSATSSLKTRSTFHPKFTYPIFGEEERIFGYQNLDIHLTFAAHDLLPNLQISYDKKFKAVGDTSALDLHKTLKDWVPKGQLVTCPSIVVKLTRYDRRI